MVTEQTKCRLCQNADIKTVLDFGESALANAYLSSPTEFANEFKAPLEVFLCPHCSSVQLKHTVDPEVLFKNYLYESSTSASFRKHFENYACHVWDLFQLNKGNVVVDIGSNDGILLKPFQKLGARAVGVEPATNLVFQARSEGLETYHAYFNKQTAVDVLKYLQGDRAQIVTCNNCFAHIDDLHDVIEGIKIILDDAGVFIFENAYLLDTLKNNYFDQVYHEHLYYHSIQPLQKLFRSHGMSLFMVEKQPIQGGTIRCYVEKAPKEWADAAYYNLQSFINEEFRAGIYNLDYYLNFTIKLEEAKKQLHKLLFPLRYFNDKICAYGVPAKFTTFCNVMGIDRSLIDFAIDDSPLKQGKFTPQTHVPILPSSALCEKMPKYCLITAWNFADVIMKNNEEYKKRGGQFIIPLPELKIV